MCYFPSNSDNTEDKESGVKEESSGKSMSVTQSSFKSLVIIPS